MMIFTDFLLGAILALLGAIYFQIMAKLKNITFLFIEKEKLIEKRLEDHCHDIHRTREELTALKAAHNQIHNNHKVCNSKIGG